MIQMRRHLIPSRKRSLGCHSDKDFLADTGSALGLGDTMLAGKCITVEATSDPETELGDKAGRVWWLTAKCCKGQVADLEFVL